MAQKIRHKRSGILNKKPNASSLELGEIAINFNAQNPFISTLVSDGTVAEFPSKEGVQGLIDDALEEYQPGGTVDAYTKSETDSLLSGKSDVNHEHSQYLTASDIEGKADKSELNNYLTTSAASSTYATKTDLNGKADSVHTHSYNDLTDKPVIPSTEGLETSAHAEATYQPKGDYALASQIPDLTDYALKSEIPDTSNLAEKSEIPDVSDFVTSAFTEATYAKKGDTPTDVYTKAETDQLLAGKSDSAHTHDYETLTNKPDLSNFATKGEIPDTSNFVTSGFCEDHYQPKGTYVVPSDLNDYALKSELPSIEGLETSAHAEATYQPKGNYLTEHQDISGKADKSELNDYLKVSAATETYATKDELAAKANSAHTHTSSDITDLSTILAGKSDTGHSHSYNDLTDKPSIPSVEGLATKQELGNYQLVSAMSGYSTTSHTHPQYVTSGDVEEMLREYTPTANNVWHGTYAEYVALAEKDDDTLYCITDVSQQYMTRGEADALYMSLSGMSAYASSSHTHTSSDITDLSTVLSGYSTTSHTHSYNDLTDKPDLSVYLTEHQDISGKADKSELNDYLKVSAATATYATKTELSGYARVVSISQSDYDTLVSNDQVQQGVLYCIIESSN